MGNYLYYKSNITYQIMNTALNYDLDYKKLSEEVGENPILLQSFILSNNTDIMKMMDYYVSKRNTVTDGAKIECTNMIARLENIMVHRVLLTEHLFTMSMPLLTQGPITTEADDKSKNDSKTIVHPASKKEDTSGNKEVEKNKSKEKSEQVKPKSDYEKIYPTDKDKIEAFHLLLPTLEPEILALNGKDENSDEYKEIEQKILRKLKFHFKSYEGKNKYATIEQLKSIITWIKSGNFTKLSPVNVIEDRPLSISDIVKECEEQVKVNGLNEESLKDYISYYVKDNQLKEQKENEIIRTEEEFDNFCQSTLQFLFNNEENNTEKKQSENSKESEKDVIGRLYEIHKEKGWKSIRQVGKELFEWYKHTGNKTSINNAIAKAAVFIKSIDKKLYDEYVKNRPGNKTKDNKPKNESKSDESSKESKKETTEEKSKTSTKTPIKVVYPKLEEQIKLKNNSKDNMSEWLITLINKKIGVIGQLKGLDNKIEAVTILAKKAFLDVGVVGCDDWKEADIEAYINIDIRPYVSEEYSILASENVDNLKEALKVYLTKFPAGEEKKRSSVLKKVLISEIPRTSYMKKIARQIRKGNLSEINQLFKEINKEEKKTK